MKRLEMQFVNIILMVQRLQGFTRKVLRRLEQIHAGSYGQPIQKIHRLLIRIA